MGLTDDSSGTAIMIAKFAILLIIGVVVLSGIASNNLLSSTGSVSITFTDNPTDGQTVTLDGHVFEFDSNGSVTAGHIPVIIGATLDITQAHLKTAMQTYYGVN
jgi:hypothetical protein